MMFRKMVDKCSGIWYPELYLLASHWWCWTYFRPNYTLAGLDLGLFEKKLSADGTSSQKAYVQIYGPPFENNAVYRKYN